MKYRTLADLINAYHSGELSHRADKLTIDNDSVYVYDGYNETFEMHPHDLLRQALDLLQVPWEDV
jgi:hypothetical protein